MVTFKVSQLCNEGIFLLNGASAGFPLKGWFESEGERERLLQAGNWKVYHHLKVMLYPIQL